MSISEDFLPRKFSTALPAGGTMPGEDAHLFPTARRDPAILRSWQRSAIRLNPATPPRLRIVRGEALNRAIQAQAELIDVARPYLEDIHQYVEGTGYAILVADRSACILDVFGDTAMVACLTRLNLKRGTYWDEGHAGTNAVAVALREAMPVQVTGSEHYLQEYQVLACSAAPIHDVKGRIAGALAMVGPRESAHRHTLATVMAAARAISNQLQTDLFLQEANYRLAELNGVFSAISEGLIAWNQNGQIIHINGQAGKILGLSPQSVTGRPLHESLQLPSVISEALQQGLSLQDSEVTFTVEGRNVDCVISLQPILEGLRGPVGYIATMRPVEQVRQLVNHYFGAQANYTLDDFLGQSSAMWRVRRQARVASRATAPAILQGEEGVGKDLLAQAIHNESARATGPFISISCAAIPHELMVNAFMGFERGMTARPSKFELADGGTLLLDDIEHLSLEMQTQLLQIMRSGMVTRLEGFRPIPVDIRVIATTSVDLEQRVAEGSFQPDLYHRFGIFVIEVPSLRDRPEDIQILAESFLVRLSQQTGQRFQLAPEAAERLLHYPWPGNNRELMAILERAAMHCKEGLIRARDLPPAVRRGWVLAPHASAPQPVLTVEEAERDAIIRAGWAYQGQVNQMAQHLGISRSTLWRKMRAFQIESTQFKASP